MSGGGDHPGWRGADGGESQGHSGGVGHVQAIGDALEDVEGGDLHGPFHDLADLALAEIHRHPDTGLTEPGVLANQPEYVADIPASKSREHFRALP